MTFIHCWPLSLMIVAKRSPPTNDTKHRCLMLMSESISLSQMLQSVIVKQENVINKNSHPSLLFSSDICKLSLEWSICTWTNIKLGKK
jgi:hypothetical protein